MFSDNLERCVVVMRVPTGMGSDPMAFGGGRVDGVPADVAGTGADDGAAARASFTRATEGSDGTPLQATRTREKTVGSRWRMGLLRS
jgi:hypothetical protein